MYIRYFCRKHAERVLASETDAMGDWIRMMNMGQKALVSAQSHKTDSYFGSALDIALLRCTRTSNMAFEFAHIRKPAEQLFKVLLKKNDFEGVRTTLEIIDSCIPFCGQRNKEDMEAFVLNHSEKIEHLEEIACRDVLVAWGDIDLAPMVSQVKH